MCSHKIHLVASSAAHSSVSIHLVVRIVRTLLWLTFLIKFLCNRIKWMISYTSYTQVGSVSHTRRLTSCRRHQQHKQQRQKQHSFNVRHRLSTFLCSWCVFRCVERCRSDTHNIVALTFPLQAIYWFTEWVTYSETVSLTHEKKEISNKVTKTENESVFLPCLYERDIIYDIYDLMYSSLWLMVPHSSFLISSVELGCTILCAAHPQNRRHFMSSRYGPHILHG